MGQDITRPSIDADLHEALWRDVRPGEVPFTLRDFTLDDLPAMRQAAASMNADDETLRHGGRVEVSEFEVPGYKGDPDVSVLVLRPVGSTRALPAVLHTSCGGKMDGHRRAVKEYIAWVADFEVVLVSVGVRAGPEHKHPAQVHDAYAALLWTAAHAASNGIDLDRIAVLGASGGGGVAAGTALFARDHGGPTISHLILLSPMLDDRNVTVSNRFEGVSWTPRANATGWTAILGETKGGPLVDSYAAPSRASYLGGLPPIYLETGSADTFRDECIDFAARAGHAGVPVELHSWAGWIHATDLQFPDIELSRATKAARNSYLRRILGPTGTGLVANARS